jgi:hypothetical protein
VTSSMLLVVYYVGLTISTHIETIVENAVPKCDFSTGVCSSPLLGVKAARDRGVLVHGLAWTPSFLEMSTLFLWEL